MLLTDNFISALVVMRAGNRLTYEQDKFAEIYRRIESDEMESQLEVGNGSVCYKRGNKHSEMHFGLFFWLCLTFHRQRGHLETAPPITIPCEGREGRFLYLPHRESNPESLRGSPLHNRCATLRQLHDTFRLDTKIKEGI